jgi:hypothetical protein
MIRLLTALVFVLASMATAPAFQKFEEYRIAGSEIRSVRLGPQEVEDPATLIIELVSESTDTMELMIESDGSLDECKTEIEYMIGDRQRYVEIVAHITADTMNGVMVVRCSTVSMPVY